ncbi:hypothetical protein DMENIID0001_086040 [Sergentomyia squamirostris]
MDDQTDSDQDFDIVSAVKLIEEVRKHACLYEKRGTAKFVNRQPALSQRTTAAWRKVGQHVQKHPDTCKLMWRKLRSIFIEELKKEKQTGDPSIWGLYQNLSFLEKHINWRTTRSNTSDGNTSGYCSQFEEDVRETTETTIEIETVANYSDPVDPVQFQEDEYIEYLVEDDVIFCPEFNQDREDIIDLTSDIQIPDDSSDDVIIIEDNMEYNLDLLTNEVKFNEFVKRERRTVQRSIPASEHQGFHQMMDRFFHRMPAEDIDIFQIDTLQRAQQTILYRSQDEH